MVYTPTAGVSKTLTLLETKLDNLKVKFDVPE